jgi:nucleoside-diphosphate-sugar epimerase
MNFVTGGTGLVGMHLIAALLHRGEQVRMLVREGSDLDPLERFLAHSKADRAKLETVTGDLADVPSLEEGMAGCERVFHAAALVSFHRKDKEKLFSVNTEGTANVVNVALSTDGLSEMVYISSVAALGRNTDGTPVNEQTEWKDGPELTNYAKSKHMAEREVWRGREEGLRVFIVNPSIILGIGDFRRSSAEIFRQVDKGMPFFPPGSNGFVAVQDVVAACFHALESDMNGERFLLSGEHLSYDELFHLVAESIGAKAPDKAAPPWLMKLARIGASLGELFTGKRAFITKEGVRNAQANYRYDASKIKGSGFTFTPIRQVIAETGSFYLANK